MMSSVVSGDPSCHMAPLRIVNVHTEPSPFGFHDSARPGESCRLPREYVRNSKHCATAAYDARSTMATGSRGPAGAMLATRIVPPCLTAPPPPPPPTPVCSEPVPLLVPPQ